MSLNSQIADLILEKGRATAQGQAASGQAWGAALGQIGQSVAQIPKVIEQSKESADAQRARDARTAFSDAMKSVPAIKQEGLSLYDVQGIGNVMSQKGFGPEFASAAGHLDAINQSTIGFQQGRMNLIRSGAAGIVASGADPSLTNDFLEHLKGNQVYSDSTIQEWQDRIKADPAVAKTIVGYLAGPQKAEILKQGETGFDPLTHQPIPGLAVAAKPTQHVINGQLVDEAGNPLGAAIPEQVKPLSPEEIALKSGQLKEIEARLAGNVPITPKDRAELQIQRDKLNEEIKHNRTTEAAANPLAALSGQTGGAPSSPDYGYGNRYGTNTPKGLGFLGPLQRPDGSGVMTEYSMGVNIGGKETEIPTLVPTLTKEEVRKILTLRDGEKMPDSIVQKAVDFAKQRIAAGKDPFAGPGEQQALYPDLKRAAVPTVKASPSAGGAAAATLTGDDFLKSLPPAVASEVKAYSEGRRPFPSGMALKSPYFQSMIQLVGQYDPSFDAANYNARNKTRTDLTSPSGTGGKTINAMNTALQHAGKLSDLIETLDNSEYSIVNGVVNPIKSAIGKTAVTNFNAVAPQLMKEIERAWRGSGGSAGEIQELIKSIGQNQGRQQQREALNNFVELLKGKLDSTQTQRDNVLGAAAGKDIPVLFEKNKPIMETIAQRAAGAQAPAAPKMPSVGETVTVGGGKRIKITAIHPDGSFDGDPVQ